MSRFNTGTATVAAGTGPIVAAPVPSGLTALGAPGYARTPKSELFLLAVANMVTRRAHHEQAAARDSRFVRLVTEVALDDVAWVTRFLPWLRRTATMRTAALVAGAEALHAREQAGLHSRVHNPKLITGAMARGDEPGEMFAYWRSRFGRSLPKAFRAGVAAAMVQLYTQRSTLKYDTDGHGYRFGDLVELFHPDPYTWQPEGSPVSGRGFPPDRDDLGKARIGDRRAEQAELFRYLLDRRRGRHDRIGPALSILNNDRWLWQVPPKDRRAMLRDTGQAALVLRGAGFTWERLASWLDGPMDATAWGAAIQIMGYEARLKNLRNFDDAGVPDTILERVAAELADPDQVARSRQLPIRFLTAYRAVQHSLRWAFPLERALNASLANIPALPGRTLVLVDQSPSMFKQFGCYAGDPRDEIELHDTAAIFGAAVALRAADATLVQYGGASEVVDFRKGESVLKLTERFRPIDYTRTFDAMRRHYRGHDRVLVITDEQTAPTGPDPIPPTVPVFTWNLGGYQYGQLPTTRNRITLGGLSDAAFAMIGLIERGHTADWPF